MTNIKRLLLCSFFFVILVETLKAAPGTRSTSLEEASLQLGTLQAQAQYPPAAVQGARTASRSAASCLVTKVQYTHGQQIWRADPCEFCLCLDGEMFCWWQDCPPASPGPCPGPQPFSLCGNSSGLLEPPLSPIKKTKKASKKGIEKNKKQMTKLNSKPLVTVSQNLTATQRTEPGDEKINTKTLYSIQNNALNNGNGSSTNRTSISIKRNKENTAKQQPFYTSMEFIFNFTDNFYKQDNTEVTPTKRFDTKELSVEERTRSSEDENKSSKYLNEHSESSTDSSITGCIVMGKLYRVGEMLPSTGSCLTCHCTKGNGANSPARVSCAPRGCAPPDPAPEDETGAF